MNKETNEQNMRLSQHISNEMLGEGRQIKWRRYRFYTKSVDDYRPLVFNPKYPWWCSGYAADESYATIVAYLPENEDLSKYWDDAFGVEYTEHETIEFSGRFPKPKYFKN